MHVMYISTTPLRQMYDDVMRPAVATTFGHRNHLLFGAWPLGVESVFYTITAHANDINN